MAAAVIAGLAIHYLAFALMKHFARRTRTVVDDSVLKNLRRPSQFLLPLIMTSLFLPSLTTPPTVGAPLRHIFSLAVIGAVAWLLVGVTAVFEDFILGRLKLEERDNLQARKLYTQIQIFKKIVIFVVAILAFAAMLMTFEKVRQLGAAILASAGIVGIIVGLATQRTITTILAGLQIAVTQPIRVDDVVIVENEWGRIEEITFTYVVVRIWDLRRLVLPITYFLEKPFQNWTRVTADILGTVFLYVDYTVPVQSLRDELHRVLEKSSNWDGRVWGLQVTNTTERTVELRALMSASDASSAWNLRCEVREKLLEFVQRQYPDGLPKLRAEIRNETPGKRSSGKGT